MLILELWETELTSTLLPPQLPGYARNRQSHLEPDARFVRTFEADTYDAAMQLYYDYKGWGHYTPMADGPPRL